MDESDRGKRRVEVVVLFFSFSLDEGLILDCSLVRLRVWLI